MDKKIIEISSALATKNFIETANNRIFELENALYSILDAGRLDVAKEIAADVLHEDLETYLEEEGVEELDFEDDDKVDWEAVDGLSEE